MYKIIKGQRYLDENILNNIVWLVECIWSHWQACFLRAIAGTILVP